MLVARPKMLIAFGPARCSRTRTPAEWMHPCADPEPDGSADGVYLEPAKDARPAKRELNLRPSAMLSFGFAFEVSRLFRAGFCLFRLAFFVCCENLAISARMGWAVWSGLGRKVGRSKSIFFDLHLPPAPQTSASKKTVRK